jgi:hypothetical protein
MCGGPIERRLLRRDQGCIPIGCLRDAEHQRPCISQLLECVVAERRFPIRRRAGRHGDGKNLSPIEDHYLVRIDRYDRSGHYNRDCGCGPHQERNPQAWERER